MVITATKTCAYWSCCQEVKGRNYLCRDHYEDLQDKIIDKCPVCGRYKNEEYELCLECKKQKYKVEHSKAWDKADEGADHFFAYILKLDDGFFYVGQTRELRERMSEHRDGKEPSTAGRDPQLQYFEVLSTRESAEQREVELKKIKDTNPRQIRRMIITFQDLLREVDNN